MYTHIYYCNYSESPKCSHNWKSLFLAIGRVAHTGFNSRVPYMSHLKIWNEKVLGFWSQGDAKNAKALSSQPTQPKKELECSGSASQGCLFSLIYMVLSQGAELCPAGQSVTDSNPLGVVLPFYTKNYVYYIMCQYLSFMLDSVSLP